MTEQEENEKKITKCMMDLVKLYAKDKKPIDADLDMFGVHYKLSFTAEPSNQKEVKLECIDQTNGETKSGYLKGIEEFLKYQSKETHADVENKALFIVAADGNQVICSTLGKLRKNILLITSAMQSDQDIANVITLASLLFTGKYHTVDELIEDIAKQE